MGLFKKIREAAIGDLTADDFPATEQERKAEQAEREREAKEKREERK